MAYLLALETTSNICSVALFNKNQLLGLSELQIEKSHSSHITVLIGQLLENCKVALGDLAAVAISGGPGSYTGLRIGSSTAKGLCFALDIPLIEVSTLQGLAAAMVAGTPAAENYYFCPMIDARRSEVYTCLFQANLQEVFPVTPLVLEESSLSAYLSLQPVIFGGSGASKFQEITAGNPRALFLSGIKPSAANIGALAWQKYQFGKMEDVAYYEPFYLKEVYITTSKQK